MFDSGWNTDPIIVGLLMVVGTPIALALLYWVTGPHNKGPKGPKGPGK